MDIDTEKLKRWREERFWSQEHLAELAGVALRTVQRIETGGNASRESITALAAAFNVDTAALHYAPEDQKAEEAKQKLENLCQGFAYLSSFRLPVGFSLWWSLPASASRTVPAETA